jgi:hypothetical protein
MAPARVQRGDDVARRDRFLPDDLEIDRPGQQQAARPDHVAEPPRASSRIGRERIAS